MKLFGISLSTIIFVVVIAVIARKFGGSIPLLRNVSAS